MLEVSDGNMYIFACDSDAESIRIINGNISNEKKIVDMPEYRWIRRKFLPKAKLDEIGRILACELELYESVSAVQQIGIKLFFGNGEYLHVWTIPSDNIFYGLNREPDLKFRDNRFSYERVNAA